MEIKFDKSNSATTGLVSPNRERERERERNVGDNNATGWTFKRGVKDYTGGSKHTMLMSE
jgi:hypothetical protein